MKRNLTLIVSAFIALSALVLAVLVIVHQKEKTGEVATLAGEERAGIRIDDVHYTSTGDGRVEWELDAKSATRFTDEDLLVLDSVRFVFYASDGTYTLTAEKGNYREKAGVVDVSGDVEVSSMEGDRLKTESLTYFIKSKEITSPDPVEIVSRSLAVTGVGLRGDLEEGRFHLLRDVRAVLSNGAV